MMRVFIAVSYLMLLNSCSGPTETAGGVVDTGNTLTGVILDGTEPAEGVIATLYPEDFNPVRDAVPDSHRVITNEKGEYTFTNPNPGTYNIQVIRPEDNSAVLISAIEMPESEDTSISVRDAALGPASRVNLHIQELELLENGHLYIPGTGVVVRITQAHLSTGFISLEEVPGSEYSELLYASPESEVDENILRHNLFVAPGIPFVMGPYYAWSDTVNFAINTSQAGAGIQGNHLNYPLLLRLNQAEAGLGSLFAEAGTNGMNLRFTKSDGVTPIDFEIEEWDAGNGKADIWVAMDTVYGDNAGQNIQMYWGRPGASSLSSGSSVFNTQGGYLSVWHLNQEGNSTAAGYIESSDNLNHGTGMNMDASASVEGVVGGGQYFAGDSNYIQAAQPVHLTGNAGFTLSFWMQFDYTTLRAWIMYFGASPREQGIHLQIRQLDSTAQFGPFDAGAEVTPNQNTFDVKPYHNIWTYVTVTYNNQSRIFTSYINGIEVASSPVANLNIQAVQTMLIGAPHIGHNFESSYKGNLDELRIENRPRDENWIKLNYELQKPGSSIVGINN